MSTTLLRDNNLVLADMPGRIAAARAELEAARLARDAADLAVISSDTVVSLGAGIASQPRVPAKVRDAAASRIAFQAALTELEGLGRVTKVLNRHGAAAVKRNAAASDLLAAIKTNQTAIGSSHDTIGKAVKALAEAITRETDEARKRAAAKLNAASGNVADPVVVAALALVAALEAVEAVTHLLAWIPYEKVKDDEPKLGKRQKRPDDFVTDRTARNVVPTVF